MRPTTRVGRHTRWLLGATAALVLAAGLPTGPVPTAAAAQEYLPYGSVVSLQGTPHLWVADVTGVMHWAGDTRSLAGKHVDWANRIELSVGALRLLSRSDPWVSAKLLKLGDAIYFPKWETGNTHPTLLHIRSIDDLELFGIDGINYGALVVDQGQWERQYGLSVATLPRGELAAALTVSGPRFNGRAPDSCEWRDVEGRRVYGCFYADGTLAVWRGPDDPTLLVTTGPNGQADITPAGRLYFAAPAAGPRYSGVAPVGCQWATVSGQRLYGCAYPDQTFAFWSGPTDATLLSTQSAGQPIAVTAAGAALLLGTPSGTTPAPAPATTGSAINATITSDFSGWDGDTVFVLDNGQVWQQAEYAYEYHYAYRPKVIIFSASGGWKMRVEGMSRDIGVRLIR